MKARRYIRTMLPAYVLVQTEVGMAARVAEQLARIAGVVSSEVTAGPYDVIARAESADLDELGRLVVANIQGARGVTRTVTCPVVVLRS
jgi:DNA-binding Lrp family transcriptional regulator